MNTPDRTAVMPLTDDTLSMVTRGAFLVRFPDGRDMLMAESYVIVGDEIIVSARPIEVVSDER